MVTCRWANVEKANEALAHCESSVPVLLARQHEQQLPDGGVIDTLTDPQSATAALLLPLTVAVNELPQALPPPDIETVPAPTAVNENPEPCKQHPDVLSVNVKVAHGIEQADVTGAVSKANTNPSSSVSRP